MKRAIVTTMLLLAAGAAGQTTAPALQLPRQQIVFVIDNSGSMDDSDPLKLRGVAAGLVLDAAEISSNVEAGLVIFSDRSTTDGKLQPPDVIRQRLHAGRLPPAAGGTEMYDALAKGIAILQSASGSASIKRIVLITDGVPTSNAQEILNQLVPNANASGIQIFALGMSGQVNRSYLDALTRPTGGMTLIAEQHTMLLRRAKELMGDRDNVFTLADPALASTVDEYAFTIGPGVDRARITALLDNPSEFSPGQMTLTLVGPPSAGERPYVVRSPNGDRVAAWTAFFSTPGNYRLKIETATPGGHKGLHLFVEALSTLNLQLTLNPPAKRYEFGTRVKLLVTARTGAGSIDPTTLTLNGTVLMPGGGTEVITFHGAEGEFEVRDVPGQHTVIVRGASPLARAEARTTYTATQQAPAELTTSPAKLDFVRPLGPTDPKIETTFKLVPRFAPGATPRPIRVGFMMTTPTGEPELIDKAGGSIRINTSSLFSLPPSGAEMTLRIKLDPRRPLPAKSDVQNTVLRIYSNETEALVLPCLYRVNIPAFEVRKPRKTVSLWWDPQKPRTVSLGRLHTDLAEPSTFSVTLPDQILDPNRGTKIADVVLRIGNATLESEPAEAGRVTYGPIDLEPGKDARLELVITPSTATGWERLPASRKSFDVDLQSDLGMQTRVSPIFQTLGGPWFGWIDRHGHPMARALFLGLFVALIAILTVHRLGVVRRFWRYRPGQVLMLASQGSICVGEAPAGDVALALPNSGSVLDDTTIGYVTSRDRKQQIESPSNNIVLAKSALTAGDTLIVSDDPAEGTQLWSMEYAAYVPGEGGELEVRDNPAGWTLGRVIRSLLVNGAVLWGSSVLLDASIVASAAYSLPFAESIYAWVLQ